MTGCWHLTFASDGRAALFPNEALRRRAVRTLARVSGRDMVLFCLVDDHLHAVLLCSRNTAARHAGCLHQALAAISPIIEPAHRRPVEGRGHLMWLVRYVLSQPQKHGLPVHPATWTGSCFADLVGARMLPGLELQLGEALPRFRLHSACAYVGVDANALAPAGDSAVRAAGAQRLVSAAAAGFAVPEPLRGKTAAGVLAKRTAVRLGTAAGIPISELAWALDVPRRSARRLATGTVDHRSVSCVRRQLGLQLSVARPLDANVETGKNGAAVRAKFAHGTNTAFVV